MDIQRIKKLLFIVITLCASAICLINPSTTQAQENCPPGTISKYGYSGEGGTLHGSYPDSILTCIPERPFGIYIGSTSERFIDQNVGTYACQERVEVPYIDTDGQLVTSNDLAVYLTLSEDENTGSELRVKFWLAFPDNTGLANYPDPTDANIIISYYSKDFSQRDYVSLETLDVPRYGVRQVIFFAYRVFIYEVETRIPITQPQDGGYVIISVLYDNGQPAVPFAIMSPQVRSSIHPFPALCALTDPEYFSTPTPTPAVSPTPYSSTPDPTAVYNTTPLPTTTPIPYVTLPPQIEPTSISVPTVPSIVWPTLAWPTVEVFTSTVTATETPVSTATTVPEPTIDALATAEAIATAWYSPVQLATDRLNISSTVGIQNTSENIRSAVSLISWPVRFAKAIQIYQPSLWPYISIIFAIFGLIVFTTITKFILDILSTVLSVLRKLWELIPFN